MKIRKSNEHDVQDIMTLIHQAQSYFKDNGIDQWQDGYPKAENILDDIQHNGSYVLEDDGIIGTMFCSIEDDPNYASIDGKWKTENQAYAVIHRIVVDENRKGQNLARKLLEFAVELCHENDVQSIRIDTHLDNLSMQRFLLKNGFVLCGDIILLQSGAPRIAFEKIIE